MAPSRHVLSSVVAGTAVLLPLTLAGPAAAHGAPVSPVSRAAACASGSGQYAGTAACRAAAAANGGSRPFADWDNLRVAGVAGRDRQVISDGKLCSGGLAAFRGLDLPRTDWPATRLTPGAGFTMAYGTTIPHQGTFRIYLTKEGYDPSRPLTWSALASDPFVKVTDPPVSGGAYRISGRLPSDRTGRHVLFTIWQNSSTPDTYYSCSDVVFPAAAAKAPARPAKPARPARPSATAATTTPEATASRSTASPSAARTAESAAAAPASPRDAVRTPATQPVAAESEGPGRTLTALAGATALGGMAAVALLFRLRRSPGARRR
ncbi:lytic polysaccharide monooxygenase [Actinacidiphila sp. bgisy160]|uniref:lytic polysaccharide monooxygenase n=1 Tax=Actinacidiphila sp. bgisy160 TaxID=3413796 RepID=UPI003D743DE2